MFLVALLVLGLFALAVLFYARHFSSQRLANQVDALPTEGVYFKRYVPTSLYKQYDAKHNTSKATVTRWWLHLSVYILSVAIVFAALYILFITFIQNADRFSSAIDRFDEDTAAIDLNKEDDAVIDLNEEGDAVINPSEKDTAATDLKEEDDAAVDLNEDDIAALDYRHHQWIRDVDTQLPSLADTLASMRLKGILIPYSKKDKAWRYKGENIRRQSLRYWQRFAKNHKLKVEYCNWKRLDKCTEGLKQWVTVVLPGYWDFNLLDKALAKGANLITYGPPAQLFKGDVSEEVDWHGLSFKRAQYKDAGAIALFGDQLLTLGFDAGLIVEAYQPFSGYRVLSEQPQAVSIGQSYVTDGEELVTRLYAKTVGKGRLVWLDFEPVSDDNAPDINPVRLDSVVASIFRYFSRQPYSTIASWPDGKRFAGIIVEDTEDNFLNTETVVDLFQEKGYPITWNILSNEALKQRRLTRKMAQVGEIACHGDNHSLFTNSGFEKQVERIARCQKALEVITGVKPLAFRPPEEKHNKFTIDAIANNDMTHFIANQMEDRAVPEIYVSESDRKSLVSIPRVVSDDHEIWQTRSLDYQNTVRLMQEEVELVYRIGGIYMFGFHNQFIRDKERMDAVMFLAEKLTDKNAFFATSKDVAEWWRLRSAMLRGQTVDTSQLDRYMPMQLTVESDGVLTYSDLKYSNE